MTLSSIRDSLVWAPDWFWGVAVLLIAAICALIAHRLIFMAFDRAFRARRDSSVATGSARARAAAPGAARSAQWSTLRSVSRVGWQRR
jgi:hypothetical protein